MSVADLGGGGGQNPLTSGIINSYYRLALTIHFFAKKCNMLMHTQLKPPFKKSLDPPQPEMWLAGCRMQSEELLNYDLRMCNFCQLASHPRLPLRYDVKRRKFILEISPKPRMDSKWHGHAWQPSSYPTNSRMDGKPTICINLSTKTSKTTWCLQPGLWCNMDTACTLLINVKCLHSTVLYPLEKKRKKKQKYPFHLAEVACKVHSY